jgi:RimJ/RimL family protein N-acetyltransferase
MVQFVKFEEKFLELSWKWLNNKEIRELINVKQISKKEQIEWFNLLPKKNDYLIYGITYNNVPVGVTGLKNITENNAEYWGYIGEKEYWGKGIGKAMMHFAIENAQKLQLESIYLKVLKSNQRAIYLYKSLNFKITSEQEGLLIMELNLY